MPHEKMKIIKSVAYKEHVKKQKAAGALKIATPAEFYKINERLRKRREKKNWVGKLKDDVKKELKRRKQLRSYGVSKKEIERVRGKKK